MVAELGGLEMERRSEQTAIDGARRQARESLRRAAHLDQRHVTVSLEIPLTEHVAQQKIVRGAEAADADLFALQIFAPLDLRLDHDLLSRLVVGTSEHHQIRSGKIGLDDRRN